MTKMNRVHVLVGFLAGMLVAGSAVYVWMDRRLQAERSRAQLVEELLDAAIEEIPKPPFPPSETL